MQNVSNIDSTLLSTTNFEMTDEGGGEGGDQKWFLELPWPMAGS